VSYPDRSGAFPTEGNYVFRPGLLWRTASCAAGLAGVFAAVVFAFALAPGIWWVLVGSGLLSIGGAVVAVRAWIADIAIARDRVRVRGVLYSRTIPRKQILDVDQGLRNPFVTWRTRRGVLVFTPLTVLSIGTSVLPSSAYSKSGRFLARLGSWAGSR
jgi:hypothetical protein